jgi:methionyl-tRNA synthetase
LLNPIVPLASTKVLDALNIKTELRNLSFLDGKNVINSEIKIQELDILFKKITQ